MRSTLGKYRLIAEIGRGGMAAVYLASQTGLHGGSKLVVVKEPRLDATEDADVLTMFLDEARLAARLNHRNVVQTYEVGEEGGRPFIAMEYLEGQALSRVRAELVEHQRSIPLMLYCLCEVLEGLQYAHDLADYDGSPLGVVHRDVTPHNVLVTYEGQVKLVDFGIAKAATSSAQTRSGVLKGKLKYMSPEQISHNVLDRRADVYAVGVMLWETITGRRMFDEVNDAAVLHRIMSGDIPRARDLAPHLPESLLVISERALETDRDRRYPDAREMQAELQAYIDAMTPRPGAREMQAALAGRFERDRQKISLVVEAHMADLRMGDEGVPVLSPDEAGRSMGTGRSLLGVAQRSTVPPPLDDDRGGDGKRQWLQLVAVAAVSTLAVTATVMSSGEPGSTVARGADVDAAPAPSVSLRVTVHPASAQLFLDDEPLATGAYEGSLPQNRTQYRLRAQASGYVTQEQTFSGEQDVTLRIRLEAETTTPPAKPEHRAPTTSRPGDEKTP